MRIAQIVLAGASEYERKCQRVDFAALSSRHEIVDGSSAAAADVVHVYGPHELPRAHFTAMTTPYVASGRPKRARFAFRKVADPAAIVSPLAGAAETYLPEAVESAFFDADRRDPEAIRNIGTFGPARAGVRNMVEQTMTRIHRFRDDVTWTLTDTPPTPETLRAFDLWVDPSTAEDDLDGFAAEALVAGKPVIASRTPVNFQRLEKGRTGWLVPPGDPNELVHAILSALFKPEVAERKIEAAQQTRAKFDPRQRLRILERLYETLTR